MSVISFLVGECHVGMDYLAVVRYVLSKLSGGRKRFFTFDRQKRRAILRECLSEHRDNRELYRYVMRGGL